MTYKIVIEELIRKAFYVEAPSAEEAMSVAQQQYRDGLLILDGDSIVADRHMCVAWPKEDKTEWTEF